VSHKLVHFRFLCITPYFNLKLKYHSQYRGWMTVVRLPAGVQIFLHHKSKSHYDWRTVSQSSPFFGLMTRSYSLSLDVYRLCPRRAPIGLSCVRILCHIYMVFTFFLTLCTEMYYFVCMDSIYTIYKASVSPGFVQQIMPYFSLAYVTTAV
jgi:hypothetical protein